MRTIENVENFMLPLDKVIKQKLIPVLFNDFQISEELRSLIALLCKLGGMGIINPVEIANEEYVNSRELTKKLTNLIIQQEHSYTVSEDQIKKIRSKIQKKRMEKQQRTLSSLRDKMSYMEIRLNDLAQEQGSSSWLTVLSIKQLGFNLTKSDFWDAVRLRYGLPLKGLPSHCGCSKPYNVQHAIACKKGGFVTLRHNELRGNIAEMLEEVTSDVKVESALQPLSGEEIKGNQSDEARSDTSARGFWIRGQRAFFDIRVLDPNAQRHQSKTLRKCYEINQQEKKREYSSRILNVEQGTFTPPVLSATGGMGRECSMFVKKLSQLISIKRKEELSVVTYGIRCKISFALLRSCLLCIRGSRKSNNEYEKLNEISFNAITIVKRNDN